MESVQANVRVAQTTTGTAGVETNDMAATGTKGGHQYVQPWHSKHYEAALQGRYFVGRNATLATGIASHTAPDLADNTKAMLIFRNIYSASSGKIIIPDYIRLTVTAAGGSDQTAIGFKVAVEPGATGSRYTSGGTNYTGSTFKCPYSENSTVPEVLCDVGVLLTTAESSVTKYLHGHHAREVDRVIGDNYIFTFGETMFQQTSNVLAGTTQANIIMPCGPVALGPNASILIHEKAPSQTTTGASYEWEMGFFLIG